MPIRKGFFITGTDTGVGKTFITAGIASELLMTGIPVQAIKPVQTGCEEDDDMAFCREFTAEVGEIRAETLHKFVPPVSPHLAAREADTVISLEQLSSKIAELAENFEGITLIEGAGGIFVPLNESETMLDLMRQLDYPVILVVANRLGAINHALLSIETLRNNGLELAGLVINETTANAAPEDARLKLENRNAIEKFAKVEIMGEIPFIVNADTRFFERKFDCLLEKVREHEKDDLCAKNSDWKELLEFDREHIWHPYTSATAPLPVYPVDSASGCVLHTPIGDLIEGMSSWWCAAHGYNNPELNAAILRQLSKVSHVMFGGITHEPAVRLSHSLLEKIPEMNHVFFSDSGSVAVEVALKMGLQYQQSTGNTARNRFLTVCGGYYGDTFAAMSVCDPVNGMHSLFSSFIPQQIFVVRPECRFDAPFDPATLRPLKEAFENNHKNLAAMIIEPIVQGAGGMWFYHPEYLKAARDLCDEYGIPLILDEIASGFGRTGRLFAKDWAGITPDIMCIGKALSGGMITLGATLCTREIAAGISKDGGVFMHGPTFMGNPLACAVALASMRIFERSEWKNQVEMIEVAMKNGLEPCRSHPDVADIRVLGAIGVVEMNECLNVAKLQEFFVQKGVWIRPFGKLIYLMPPYIISPEQLDSLCTAVREAVFSLKFR